MLLDIILTLVAPYFSGPLDVFGRIISAYAKRKNIKLIWDKLLYGAVPKFRGLFGKYFTAIRTAIWRATGSIISNSYTSLIGKFIGKVNERLKSNSWKTAIDIISCFFSAGSMIAAFLDYADRDFNETVNFRR